ncbi:MAG TPA: Spy/CpxP family protein refolding chaperone [Pyrinomonadaceae bacterium]|jgi:Spy/CpxP family protein refolding chaperone
MSLKRKIISGIVSAFAVVTFTTFVSAQDTSADKSQQDSTQKQERRERRGGFGNREGGRRGGMMRGFEKLNLTDAQKEQIHTILEANKPDKSSFEAIRPLMEAKRNGTITAEQETQLKAFREQQKQKGEQVRSQILAILTTEQKAQLEKQKEEWKQKREERKQNRQNQKSNEKDDDDDDTN